MFKALRGSHRAGCAITFTLLSLASSTAYAFDVKRTSTGLPLHWGEASIVLETDPSVEAMAPEAAAGLEEAAATWSTRDGAPAIRVRRSSTPEPGLGDAHRGSGPLPDGRNVVYFYPEGYPAAGSALAITIVTYDDATGLILDADIVLNGVYPFAVLPAGMAPTATARPVSNDGASVAGELETAGRDHFDVVHVVAHEVGHALGLSDETSRASSLMYLYSLPGDSRRRSPAADDLRGLDELYGAPVGRGCGSSMVSPRSPPRDLPVALFVAPLAAWAIRRRYASGASPRRITPGAV